MEKYNQSDLEEAICLYNKIKPIGKDVFGKKINISNSDFDETYDTNIINKASFTNCRFIKTPFIGVSSAYSSYPNCLFYDCETKNTNFTFCDFSYTHIYGIERTANWIANDFSYSMFYNAIIKNVYFEGTAFYQAVFDNATLKKLSFKHCCFDSVTFCNSTISDVDFSNIEILLCNFENANIINSKFTFIMLLNNFGLLPIYMNDYNSITVFSGENKIIDRNEVLNCINKLIPLFWANHDFFPLCNIYLNLHNINTAYKVLLECLEICAKDSDFIQINHLCKLAVYCKKIPIDKLNDVYKFISNAIDTSILNYSDTRRYLRCNDEIKYLLQINPNQQPSLYLSLKTDITQDNTEQLGCLLKSIEKALREIDDDINPLYNIQKHSPYEIVLIVCAATTTLLPIAQFFYYLSGSFKSAHDLKSSHKKGKNIIENEEKSKNGNEPISSTQTHTKTKSFSFGKFKISFTSEEVKTLQLVKNVSYIIDDATASPSNKITQDSDI